MKTINYYTKISIALLLISVTVSTSQAQRKLEKARELKENYQYSNLKKGLQKRRQISEILHTVI
jgi:hypothetical protein